MIQKPDIPTKPDALPDRRSTDVAELPLRPDGFRGFCHWYDEMPEAVCPKGSPRKVEYLGSVEWAWSPAHDRYDAYYIGRRGRYWCLWRRWQDSDAPGQPWRWELFGWARRGRESREVAACCLLVDAWRADDEHSRTGRFHWVAEVGCFSAAVLTSLADQVWPPRRGKEHS